MKQADTIAAIATPGGRGGIGIVRISGPSVRSIARTVLGRLPAPRRAEFHRFRAADGEAVDAGIALFFPAPNSFTGEDVLELQGHGGPVVLDMVLERLLELGARLARPGEFSERAFLNDRLDLAQAEAIADLIDSGSRTAALSSLRSLEGEFSVRVHALVDSLTMLRVRVEAGIDFPEEELDIPGDSAVREGFDALEKALATLIESTRQGCLMREGIRVVIAGAPNVGKSSLLNRLARRDTAIVSDIPGTTRDVLHEHIEIDGLPLHVIDTAGLRDSDDPIERIGIARARAEIEQADRILLLVEDGDAMTPVPVIDPAIDGRLTILRNKIDLSGRTPGIIEDENGITTIRLSARSDAGIDLLCRHLKACMGYVGDQEGGFIARRRHLEALRQAGAHIDAGRQCLTGPQAIELAAEELRQAQQALGEITGMVSSDELLGHIFASFCIGK